MVFDYSDRKRITETEKGSIENNLGTIATTPYGSAPFLRSMGIKHYPPETNSEFEQNLYATELITQAGIWEDRVEVTEVQFNSRNEVRMVLGYG